jgi:hypothetical protein
VNAVVPVVILWVVKLSIDRVAPAAGHREPMSRTTWVLVGSEYANNEARGAGVKSGGDRCRNLRSLAHDFLSGRLFGDADSSRRAFGARAFAEAGLIGNIAKLPQIPVPRARQYLPLLVVHACRSLHSATRRIGPAFLFDGYLTLYAIV